MSVGYTVTAAGYGGHFHPVPEPDPRPGFVHSYWKRGFRTGDIERHRGAASGILGADSHKAGPYRTPEGGAAKPDAFAAVLRLDYWGHDRIDSMQSAARCGIGLLWGRDGRSLWAQGIVVVDLGKGAGQ